jgi:hypothetical protein
VTIKTVPGSMDQRRKLFVELLWSVLPQFGLAALWQNLTLNVWKLHVSESCYAYYHVTVSHIAKNKIDSITRKCPKDAMSCQSAYFQGICSAKRCAKYH